MLSNLCFLLSVSECDINTDVLTNIIFLIKEEEVDEDTLFRYLPLLISNKEYEFIHDYLSIYDTSDPNKKFDWYRILLQIGIQLEKPIEVLQRYADLLLQNIPNDLPTQSLLYVFDLFIKSKKQEYITILYRNHFENHLELQDSRDKHYLLNLLIDGLQFKSINSYIDEYLEIDTAKLEIDILQMIIAYIKIYDHQKALIIRQYLMKFINTEYDSLQFRALLNNLCYYEYSKESLEIQKSYYLSIKDTPQLQYPEYLIAMCTEFMFFDMVDIMIEWIYYFWKNNLKWDLWTKFLVQILLSIHEVIDERRFYILKNKYIEKEIIVIQKTILYYPKQKKKILLNYYQKT